MQFKGTSASASSSLSLSEQNSKGRFLLVLGSTLQISASSILCSFVRFWYHEPSFFYLLLLPGFHRFNPQCMYPLAIFHKVAFQETGIVLGFQRRVSNFRHLNSAGKCPLRVCVDGRSDDFVVFGLRWVRRIYCLAKKSEGHGGDDDDGVRRAREN